MEKPTRIETIPQLFERSVERYPENIALWEKKTDRYEGLNYHDLREKVYCLAAGLMAMGIKKGDRVGLISEGRNDWVISELGILYAGGVNVPISVKVDELSDLKFRLSHSGCRAIIVSGGQNRKIRQIKGDLADLEKVIVMDSQGSPEGSDPDEMLLEELIASGREFLYKNKAAIDETWQSIRGADPANICYTSGTTADPKGIVLTHRNYTANVEQSSAIFDIPQWYVSLLILPWDHSFAHTAGIYTLLKNGASMASVQTGKTGLETLKNIPVNIGEVRPTFLLSVPALAKSFRKNIENGIKEKGEGVQKLFNGALESAYRYNRDGWKKSVNFLLKAKVALFDLLLFSRIRASFGGRMRFFVGGGALLDMDMQKFFYAIGMPMYQGYGLTEAAPIISANTPACHKMGSSGKVVPDLEIRIMDEDSKTLPAGATGEIVVKGENVMSGYWKNEKATRETLRDGWLHTGDLGYLDADGFLYVLGRFKSLLIGGDGEKYSPESIEEAITEHSHYIDQMMLYNNQSAYTTALIVPDKNALRDYLKQKGLSVKTKEGQEAALKLLESEMAVFRENGQFPARWLPSAFAVLGEGFTEQNRLLNSTMKMVRGKIVDMYRNRIDYLYTAEGKDILNHENRTIVGRMED